MIMMRVSTGLIIAFAASCATSAPAPAPVASVSPPDIAVLSCQQLRKLSSAQQKAVIVEQRGLFDLRRARCAIERGDVEEARAVSSTFAGEQGAAMRDLVEVLIALHENRDAAEVKDLASIWVSTGHADARAFVRERAFGKVCHEPWYVDMALSAWDSDRRAGRATSLPQFVRELAKFSGRPFVDGAARTEPGALTIAQGQIIEQRVDGEVANVKLAAVDAQWAIVDQRSYTEGSRTEYHPGWRVTGPDAVVTRTESVETFNVNGHTFLAQIPAFATKWPRIVVVGVLVDGGPADPPLVRALLVLPREVRTDTDRNYELTDFPSPPLF